MKETEKRNIPRKELYAEYGCLSYSSDFSKHFIFDIDLFTIMLRFFFILFFITSVLVSAFYASPAARTVWPHSISVCLQICVNVLFTIQLLVANTDEIVCLRHCFHAARIFQLKQQCACLLFLILSKKSHQENINNPRKKFSYQKARSSYNNRDKDLPLRKDALQVGIMINNLKQIHIRQDNKAAIAQLLPSISIVRDVAL